ncbi:Peroxiredoxin-6 [Eumeta japonica]|uniref:1-Cys peroxiredoxin n=1 Tax=Eumeta variegata TaxID=151549 RepID=A0A4C1YCB3_EUMVA|nr:Peroxiredoxin-6 [Eumeta japonica]
MSQRRFLIRYDQFSQLNLKYGAIVGISNGWTDWDENFYVYSNGSLDDFKTKLDPVGDAAVGISLKAFPGKTTSAGTASLYLYYKRENFQISSRYPGPSQESRGWLVTLLGLQVSIFAPKTHRNFMKRSHSTFTQRSLEQNKTTCVLKLSKNQSIFYVLHKNESTSQLGHVPSNRRGENQKGLCQMNTASGVELPIEAFPRDQFPNFTASTTEGVIDFHNWLGDSWGILFSHPADFTPVCTTELARVIQLLPEFKKRNVKVIGLSCDSLENHKEWSKDILSYAGCKNNEFPYPLIEDADRHIATMLGMIDKDELDASGIALTARAVFIVDHNKKFRLSLLYPATTGRNFNEILRVIDSLHLTEKSKVATPVDWKQGEECMVLPTVRDDEIESLFPEGVKTIDMPSGKKYLRKTICSEV